MDFKEYIKESDTERVKDIIRQLINKGFDIIGITGDVCDEEMDKINSKTSTLPKNIQNNYKKLADEIYKALRE